MVTKGSQVADAVPAIGDCDGEIGEDRSGEVERDRLVGRDQRLVPGIDEAGEARKLAQQLGTGMRDHPPLSVSMA